MLLKLLSYHRQFTAKLKSLEPLRICSRRRIADLLLALLRKLTQSGLHLQELGVKVDIKVLRRWWNWINVDLLRVVVVNVVDSVVS